jgi:hypothetical protein
MSGGPVGGPPPAPEAMVRERDDGGLPDGPMDSNEASTQSKWQVLRQLYPRVTAAQMAMTLERAEGDTARVHEILDMMNKRAIKKEQERLAEALASQTPSRPASRQASRQPSRSPAAGQQGGTSSRALVEHTPPLIEGVPVCVCSLSRRGTSCARLSHPFVPRAGPKGGRSTRRNRVGGATTTTRRGIIRRGAGRGGPHARCRPTPPT